jgi:hypothetical protein
MTRRKEGENKERKNKIKRKAEKERRKQIENYRQ